MDRVKNTVLILGAGATRAAAEERIDAEGRLQLKTEELPPLNSDFFNIANAYIQNGGDGRARLAYNEIVQVVRELRESDPSIRPLEYMTMEEATNSIFERARKDPGSQKYRNAFYDMLFLISTILASTTNEIDIKSSVLYQFLLSEMQKKQKMSIITFNYDLMVEKIFFEITKEHKEISFKFPGCYRLSGDTEIFNFTNRNRHAFSSVDKKHEGVPILKLHGSMNWVVMHEDEYPAFNLMYDKKAMVGFANTYSISPKIYYYNGEKVVYAKHKIVPPVRGKTNIMPYAMQRVWQNAEEALVTADKIILVGYSCPESDAEVRLLLREILKDSNIDIDIINSDPEIKEKYSDIFKVDSDKIYKSMKNWINNPINK